MKKINRFNETIKRTLKNFIRKFSPKKKLNT